MTRRVTMAPLLLLAGFVLPSFAQDQNPPPSPSAEAQSWLQRVVAAPRQHNYIGIFVYSSGSYMETSRIVHVVNKEGERERIEVLDGLPREVIRNNDEVKCYFPAQGTYQALFTGSSCVQVDQKFTTQVVERPFKFLFGVNNSKKPDALYPMDQVINFGSGGFIAIFNVHLVQDTSGFIDT